MQEHTETSMSGDFLGCWKEQFPIYQEQQLFLSGTAGPTESCRLDTCTGQRISSHRDSDLHMLEGCPFNDIFYFENTLFYELQSHALPL